MTPYQFNKLLAEEEWTQARAAAIVGVTDRQARRYAAGDAAIPKSVAALLRLLADGTIKEEDVKRASK